MTTDSDCPGHGWRRARPTGKMTPDLPVIAALRDKGGALYRPSATVPRDVAVAVVELISDDFDAASRSVDGSSSWLCRTTENLTAGDDAFFQLERKLLANPTGFEEGGATQPRSETYRWQPVAPSTETAMCGVTMLTGDLQFGEAVWVDLGITIEGEERTRHVSYVKGKPVAQWREWVVESVRKLRISADGVSIWRCRTRRAALDERGQPSHDGRPTNQMRLLRVEGRAPTYGADEDLRDVDQRLDAGRRLAALRRSMTSGQFAMLRLACFEGATLSEIAIACEFGNDAKRAVAEVRGILREAIFRAVEIYADFDRAMPTAANDNQPLALTA